MNIAIVLFGNMRTYELCYKSLIKNVVAEHKVSFYIHTWDLLERKTQSHVKYDEKLASLKLEQESIRKCYPNATLLFESPIDFPLDYDVTGKYELSGPKSMHASLCKSIAMMRVSQNKFDLVVITRPDVLFKEMLNLDSLFDYINSYGRDMVFRGGYYSATNSKTPNVMDSWGASDCLMVCTSNVAEKIGKISESRDLLKSNYIKWVETHLDYHLVDNQIKSVFLNYIAPESWAIRRRTKENSNWLTDVAKNILVMLQSLVRIYKICKKRFIWKYLK